MPTVWIFAQAAEIGCRRLARCAVRVREFSGNQFATLAQPGGEAFLSPGGCGCFGSDPDIVERGGARERPMMRFLGAAQDQRWLHGMAFPQEARKWHQAFLSG